MMKRRQFLQAASTCVASTLIGCNGYTGKTTGRPLNILVLGGTNFVGPAIVEQAMLGGHQVTLFNRGITRSHLFPGLEKLRGHRAVDQSDLSALQGNRQWDAVIDVWPEHSSLVDETAMLLAERTDYYFFISSIAVYSDFSQAGITEESPVHQDSPGWYGGEKVLAESRLQSLLPGRFGVARCHAILGPRDDGSAYHYWLRRLSAYDEVLAPGTGQDPVQFVDVRDVASWVIDSVEAKRPGIHNLTGPDTPVTFNAFLEQSRQAIGSEAKITWVDADFLRRQHNVRSFDNMPLWAPLDEDLGFQQISSARALAQGMQFRPVQETAAAAWRWFQAYNFKSSQFPLNGMGISREREQDLLDAWHSAPVNNQELSDVM